MNLDHCPSALEVTAALERLDDVTTAAVPDAQTLLDVITLRQTITRELHAGRVALVPELLTERVLLGIVSPARARQLAGALLGAAELVEDVTR